jgi:hemoglobin
MTVVEEIEIPALLETFYARVRSDALLGPLFNAAIDDWPAHLNRLADFWSSVMLMSGRYKGRPMAVHLRHLGAITPPMFDRWLELWTETTRQSLSSSDAAAMQGKAARIGASLKGALLRAKLEEAG